MSISKKIFIAPLIIIFLAICGYLLLVCVYMIPGKYIDSSIKKSTYIFSYEKSHYAPAVILIDNWIDSLMMLTAAHPVTENVFKAAARATRYELPGKTPTETLLHLYTQDIPPEVQKFFYHRYWHGYLVYYKPLLVFCSLPQLRALLAALQLTLFTILIIKLVQMNKYTYSYAILAVWIFMNPIATMLSLVFSSISILTFIELLIIIYVYDKWKKSSYNWVVFFLVVGCLTSYIDLLTYPLISLGIPLLFWLSLFTDKFLEAFRYSSIFSIHWIIGYVGMWASKWLIGSFVLGENLFINASKAIKMRLHGAIPGDDYTFYDCIIKQFYTSKVIVNIVIVCIIFAIIGIAIYRKRFIVTSKEGIYACIACYPCLWYAVIANHSYIHAFMTYRLLSIPLFALCLFTIQSCQFGKGNT